MADTRIDPDKFLEMNFSAYMRLLYKDFDKLSRTKSLKHYYFLRNYKFGGKKRNLILFIDEKDLKEGSWKTVIETAQDKASNAEHYGYGECRVIEVPDRDGDGDDDITLAIKNSTGLKREKVVEYINEAFEGNPDVEAVELKDLDDDDTEGILATRKQRQQTATEILDIDAIRKYALDHSDAGLDEVVKALDAVFTGDKTNTSILAELSSQARACKVALNTKRGNLEQFQTVVLPLAKPLNERLDTDGEQLDLILDKVEGWLEANEIAATAHYQNLQASLEHLAKEVSKMIDAYARIDISLERNIDFEKECLQEDQLTQVFVRMFQGPQITLYKIPFIATIADLKQMIEDKSGIPAYEQSLLADTHVLPDGDAVQDYLYNEATLNCNGRIDGGYKERETLHRIINKSLVRGNVRNDAFATGGAAWAKTKWVRDITNIDGIQFQELRDWLILNDYFEDIPAWNAWYKNNEIFLKALITEVAKGGHCEEFSYAVMNDLLSKTDKQYVYMISMYGKIDDAKRKKLADPRKKKYDHVLCLTSRKSKTNLSQLDARTTTAVDAWYYNNICTFKDFLAGTNPYKHPIAFKNLKIIKGPVKAMKRGMEKGIKGVIETYFLDKYLVYQKSLEFQQAAQGSLTDLVVTNQSYFFGSITEPRDYGTVKDKRSAKDIARLLNDAAGQNDSGKLFVKTCQDFHDYEILRYYDSHPEHVENMLEYGEIRALLYGIMNRANDDNFATVVNKMPGEDFNRYFLRSTTSRDRVLSVKHTRKMLYRYIREEQSGVDIEAILSHMGADNILDFFDADKRHLKLVYDYLEPDLLLECFTTSDNQDVFMISSRVRRAIFGALIETNNVNLLSDTLDAFEDGELAKYYAYSQVAKIQILQRPTLADKVRKFGAIDISTLNSAQYIDYCSCSTEACTEIMNTRRTRNNLINYIIAEGSATRVSNIFNVFTDAQFVTYFKKSEAARQKLIDMPTTQVRFHNLANDLYASCCGRFNNNQFNQYYRSNPGVYTQLMSVEATKKKLLDKLTDALQRLVNASRNNPVTNAHADMVNWFPANIVDDNHLRQLSGTTKQIAKLIKAIPILNNRLT